MALIRVGGGLDSQVGALREVGAVVFDAIVDRSRAIAHSRGARIAGRRLVCALGVALSLGCSDSTAPAGGELRPILFIGRTSNPRGEVTSEPAIYAVRSDGSGLERLTVGGGQALYPAWSRDGRRIAFASGGALGSEVWIMAADGTDPHPASPEAPSCPWGFATLTWDPAGTRVAAQCFWVVSVLDLRTGAATALPTSLEDTMQDPDWSPDGTRIAFGDPFRPAIFTRSPGGGERTDLMQDAADPAWSPDGRRIAFIGAGNAAPGLYIANADGSRRVHLTSPEQAVDEGPTWSPDGQWLAFHRRGTRCTSDPEPSRICFPQWGVFVVRTDGSGLRSITPDSLQATRPAW